MISLKFHCEACGAPQRQDLLSPGEAAKYLGVSDQTLGRWRRLGWVQKHQVGRGHYFSTTFLDEALVLRGYYKLGAGTEVVLR